MFFPTNLIISFLLIPSSLLTATNGDRIKDKMYAPLDLASACFRRLNGTHQIGCGSKRGGSVGVIHFCTRQEDLDFILKNGTAPPYAPVIPTPMLTPDNVNRMIRSKHVSGLLVYVPHNDTLEHYSHDNSCPNPRSSVPGMCGGPTEPVWNEFGSGLLFRDIPFPIFYVDREDYLEELKECFDKHNNHSFGTQRDRSLCSLQLNSFMYATTDTPTCLRKSNSNTNLNPVSFCQPLGDRNAWASPRALSQSDKRATVVVASRLDSTSLYDKTAGAGSPVTGLVTLLATAKLLKQMLPPESTVDKNLVFVLFNGESYDYIGSQRFVHDLIAGSDSKLPPIDMSDIHLFVELSQLSSVNDLVVAHYLDNEHGNKVVEDFVLKIRANNKDIDLDFHESPGSLPPGSIHTFVKNYNNDNSKNINGDFPGLLLADHAKSYTNRFYNSLYDNATNLNYKYMNSSSVDENSIQTYVSKVVKLLALTLHEELVGKYTGSEVADVAFIDELFHCYLEDPDCRVHRAIQKTKLQQGPLVSFYVGVEHRYNLMSTLAGLTLAWVTGDDVGEANINCTNNKEPHRHDFRYVNMSRSMDDLNTTRCFRVVMNFTEAVSPAFEIDGYDWSSGKYSTWSESTWNDISVRLFLKPSAAHENMTIAIGSMVLILSTLLVYFVKSRSDVLFMPAVPTIAPANC